MNRIDLNSLATLISHVSNPVVVVIASMVVIVLRYAETTEQVTKWLAVGIFLVVVIPGIVYLLSTVINRGRVDFDVSNRADRPLPLMVASIGALIGSSLVSRRLEIPNLMLSGNVLVVMLLILTVVSLVWKISIHTATLAAVVTLLVIFRSEGFAFFYLLLLPVGWARYQLRHHTLAQIITGAVTGIAITYATSVIFRG